MRHKETIELYKYWNELRGDRDAPMRSEISPAALGRLLPSVMLLERRDDGETVFRLAGTHLCSLRCRELKGYAFLTLFRDQDIAAVEKATRSVGDSNALVVLDTFADKGDGNAVPVEIALFPLADETPRILGIASLKKTPYWFGASPAKLDLRGIRHMDPGKDLLYLQSRPAVPIHRSEKPAKPGMRERLQLLGGGREPRPKSALRIFTVLEGGKK